MPRAPSDKMIEAEKLFNGGMTMVEIAKKLGIAAGTVRSWKNRYGWGDKSKQSKKSNRNVAKKGATLQKKKRGGQKGNSNAKGNSGNPSPSHKISPKAAIKHGGYIPVFKDALDEDEQKLIENIPNDEEKLLIEQIQLFSIRERRILQAINKYRQQNGDVAIADVTRFEEKRAFKDNKEEDDYENKIAAKVTSGDRLPGRSYTIQTHTSNKDLIIARLEQELSTIQSKKTKAIETLSKIRLEKEKMERETAGNEIMDEWISAVLEGNGINRENT